MAEGMPEHPTSPNLCPVCEKPVGLRHRFILQCQKLNKMTDEEIKQFWQKSRSRCVICFSLTHKASDCNLTNASCKAIMSSGQNKGKVCGGRHHKALHSEPSYRNNRGGKSSQQSQANNDGNNANGTGGAQGTS